MNTSNPFSAKDYATLIVSIAIRINRIEVLSVRRYMPPLPAVTEHMRPVHGRRVHERRGS